MTNDEQDRAIGNTVRRYKDARNAFVVARSEGSRVAKSLRELANALESSPQSIRFESEEIHIVRGAGNSKILDESDFLLSKIKKISRDAIAAQKEIDNLEPHLKGMDIPIDPIKR